MEWLVGARGAVRPRGGDVIALVRYLVASGLGAQRWVAPGVAFGLAVTVTFASGGDPSTTLAEGVAWLFPIAAWITVVTLNDPTPDQQAIIAAAVGGPTRLRVGQLALATSIGLIMAAGSLLFAGLASAGAFTVGDLAAGASADLVAVVAAVALGSLCARPVVRRTGWAVLLVILVSAADLAVPGAPPARIELAAFAASRSSQRWLTLGQAAAEVAVLAAVLAAVSFRLNRRRT